MEDIFGHDGEDPNLQDENGRAAIHILIDRQIHGDNAQVVSMTLVTFLENGANPNLLSADGRTVMHILIDREIDVDNGLPILVVLNALLQHGCNPNLLSADGRSALHILLDRPIDVENGQPILTVLNTLLRYGGNPRQLSADGRSAMQILMSRRIDVNNGLAVFAILNTLLQHGGDPDHHAADVTAALLTLMGQIDWNIGQAIFAPVFHRLVERGANPNLPNNTGQTALHIVSRAINMRHVKWTIMAALMRHGGDSTIFDNNGFLPVNYSGNTDAFDPTTTFLLLQDMGRRLGRIGNIAFYS